ncbi:hypothetical protein E2C01_030624 [Portunus trituberculatus]|uniref:Uncharacterized protein n=1 Tax=Portunus trituberculatus TaxID=210409 RepID=A0A5B7EQX2_PORTR|nr:hypothetical protein [Portunus trituberculatus]
MSSAAARDVKVMSDATILDVVVSAFMLPRYINPHLASPHLTSPRLTSFHIAWRFLPCVYLAGLGSV